MQIKNRIILIKLFQEGLMNCLSRQYPRHLTVVFLGISQLSTVLASLQIKVSSSKFSSYHWVCRIPEDRKVVQPKDCNKNKKGYSSEWINEHSPESFLKNSTHEVHLEVCDSNGYLVQAKRQSLQTIRNIHENITVPSDRRAIDTYLDGGKVTIVIGSLRR